MPAATNWSEEMCRNGSSNAVRRVPASVDLPELEAPLRKMIRPVPRGVGVGSTDPG